MKKLNILFLLLCLGVYLQAQEVTFSPIGDGNIHSEYPDSINPEGNIDVTIIGSDTLYALMKFDISSLSGYTVKSADLSIRADGKSESQDFDLILVSAGENWAEDTLKWSNKPSIGSDTLGLINNLDNNSSREPFEGSESELLEYINNALMKHQKTLSFAILPGGTEFPGEDMWIGGSEDGGGTYGPYLSLTVTNEWFSIPIGDGNVHSEYPDSVNPTGNIDVTIIGNDTLQAYIMFDISSIKGHVVNKAEFSIRANGFNDDQDFDLILRGAGENWAEDTLKWSNKPSIGNDTLGIINNLDKNTEREQFEEKGNNLVDHINEALSKGDNTLSFAILPGGTEFPPEGMWIGGSEDGGNGSYGPYLELEFDSKYERSPIGDGNVHSAYPDSVNPTGNIDVTIIGNDTLVAFMKFDLSTIAYSINDAEISIRANGVNDDQDFDLILFGAGNDWKEETLSWNTKPSIADDTLGVVNNLDSESAREPFEGYTDELVNYINDAIAAGKSEVSFAIWPGGTEFPGEDMWIGGREDGANGSYGPKLNVTFGFRPENDTLKAIADVYVDEYIPDANYGEGADMHIHNTDTTDKEVYLKFDISGAERDAVVGNAKLNIYIAQHNSSDSVGDYYINILASDTVDWMENEITWNNKPGANTGILTEALVDNWGSGAYMYVEGDELTHFMNDAISVGKDSITIIIRAKDEKAGRLWMADGDWNHAAKMILDYTVEPPAQDIPVIEDAYVSEVEGEQDSNFGSDADQHLLNSNDGSKWNYFKYDIGGAYKEPVSVELVAYGSIHNSNPSLENFEFQFFGTNNCKWSEDTLTWNNKVEAEDDVLLSGTLKQGGEWYRLSSPAFTSFINKAISEGDTCITLVAKGKNETGNMRAWFSGKEWRGSYLVFNYEPEAAQPRFEPAPGNYIAELDVELTTLTAGATIYYTMDGTEPTDASTEYTGPITITDTTTINAVAYAPELNPSTIATGTYNITPVGIPYAMPSVAAKYQDTVTVSIHVEPADAVIRYSDDGSAPSTIYDSPIFLESTTTIKAQAFSADFSYSSPIVEFTYEVIPTVTGVGTGPGGVGFKDLTLTGNPELSLWLKPEVIDAETGDTITLWPDASGNGNDAYNTYEEGGDNKIPNTGESQKPAPLYVENGLNGMPILQFGTQAGEDKSLIVDDADNLDGGSGISLFTVMKRNEMYADFAAFIQKRNITAGAAQEAYTFEMNGGGDPNTVQLVLNKDLFLRNNSTIDTNKFYLLNAGLNNSTGLSYFFVDGELEKTASYSEVINATEAPVIIGGFQAYSFAEIAQFNSELNMAQTVIVQNYLTAKYGLELRENVGIQRLYSSTEYIYDVIGVGKAKSIDNNKEVEHLNSGGGGIQLISNGFNAPGDYVFAGHSGAEIVEDETTKAWGRVWNVEFIGGATDVTIGFDFAAAELSTVPTTDHKLWYKATEGDDWTALDITGSIEQENPAVIRFDVTGGQNGLYTISVNNPVVGIEEYINISDNVSLYPNPAEDEVTVSLANNQMGTVEISIVDFTGRTIHTATGTKTSVNFNHSLSIDDLEKGSYYVVVKQNNNRATKMLLKN